MLLELAAAAWGLAGALCLAIKGRYAGWGFVAFFISNLCWMAFAYSQKHWFLLAQQIGFTVTSLIGMWTWIVAPWVVSMWPRAGLPWRDMR